MISVITGDIIKSGTFDNPAVWLNPLKEGLAKTGIDKRYWEIYGGDSFQLEVKEIHKSFIIIMYLKACIKTIKGLDIRMAIGIGKKSFSGETVLESNGSAFENSGTTLEVLKKQKTNLKIKTGNYDFDKEINLYFKLALIAMDNWTVNSAEAVKLMLEIYDAKQYTIAKKLDINQNAVSKRLKRAYYGEMLELNELYNKKLNFLKLL